MEPLHNFRHVTPQTKKQIRHWFVSFNTHEHVYRPTSALSTEVRHLSQYQNQWYVILIGRRWKLFFPSLTAKALCYATES